FGSWYTDPVVQRVVGSEKRAVFERRLERIRHFERMLVSEGTLLIKLWFHLSKKAQKKRMEELESRKATAWRVTPDDWSRFRLYDKFLDVSEDALRGTSAGEAPWSVIEGGDHEYRSLTAGKLIEDALRARLSGTKPAIAPPAPPPSQPLDGRTLLNSFDYKSTLDRAAYAKRLPRLQRDLNLLTRSKKMAGR